MAEEKTQSDEALALRRELEAATQSFETFAVAQEKIGAAEDRDQKRILDEYDALLTRAEDAGFVDIIGRLHLAVDPLMPGPDFDKYLLSGNGNGSDWVERKMRDLKADLEDCYRNFPRNRKKRNRCIRRAFARAFLCLGRES